MSAAIIIEEDKTVSNTALNLPWNKTLNPPCNIPGKHEKILQLQPNASPAGIINGQEANSVKSITVQAVAATFLGKFKESSRADCRDVMGFLFTNVQCLHTLASMAADGRHGRVPAPAGLPCISRSLISLWEKLSTVRYEPSHHVSVKSSGSPG